MTENDSVDPAPHGPEVRQLDMESLKALAHPLRVQILDTLSTYGQFTASGLAERLDESSGATSYHLRQLERHGFVREVEGKGTGRERWWERVPGAINLNAHDLENTPAAVAATKTVMRQWERSRSALLGDFQERGYDVLPVAWMSASVISTTNLRLTPEQLKEITEHFERFVDERLERYRGQNPPGSRPVQIHFNAFPVLDAEETPKP
ncbi:MAG: helix-turn-helix transcriptional regulator [Salinibacterium sp.]|nr:helix-turn-helix transcriptional regulator [Salinibacterium sp.]